MRESNRKMRRMDLRENAQGDFKIIASNGWVMMHVDDYENGQGKFVNEWDINVKGTYKSMQDFIRAVRDEVDVSPDLNDWGVFDGRISTNFLADEDALVASDAEIEAWKRGEQTLYIVDVYIPVKVGYVRDITEEDADALGIQVW